MVHQPREIGMQRIIVFGGGKIGTLITFLLARSKDYLVYLADIHPKNPQANILTNTPNIEYVQLNAQDANAIEKFIQEHKPSTIVSCLPYYCNIGIAKAAAKHNLHYFDLTEDTKTSELEHELANKVSSAFVPQCGLAPGFISIVANDLMKKFSTLDAVKLRVGALPINVSNALQYSLTWSTDGLINEYGNPCQAIDNGAIVTLFPLDNLEEITLDGLTYEAFNTSGGIGSLVASYQGKVNHLSYKTIRYPGHCAKMRLLMNDLKLNLDRDTLKRILENALPRTYQDVVLVYVSVSGQRDEQSIEENYVKKFYPKMIDDKNWSAIQLTTASGLCAVLDIVLSNPDQYHGFVRQEEFTLAAITHNRFGQYYA